MTMEHRCRMWMWNVVLFCVAGTGMLSAQNFWTRTEPYNYGLNQMYFAAGDTVYGSLSSGFTRSTDAGVTWTTPIIVNFLRKFDVAPNGTIFGAQNQNAVSRSTNKGASFTQSSTGITETSCSAVLVTASGTVLASARSGIFRSTNNGTNWTRAAGAAQLTEDTNIVDLVRNGNTIIALAVMASNGSEWNIAIRSTDDGATWTKAANKLSGATANAMVRTSAGHLYIRTQRGIYRSTDAGDSWSPFTYNTVAIDDIAIDSSGVIYATFSKADSVNNIFRTTDNGTTWSIIPSPYRGSTKLTVGKNGVLFLSQDQTYRSTDNGATWKGLPVLMPNTTGFKESPKKELYMTAGGSAYQTLYRSTDFGGSWRPLYTGVVGIPMVGFHGDTILAADNYYAATLLRSVDNGKTFKAITGITGLSGYINAVIGTTYRSIIAGTSTGIYRSTDHGKTWTQRSATPATFLHQLPSGTMYAYRTFSGSGVFRSTDSGSTWTELKTGMGNTLVHSLAFAPNGNLFSGSDAGLFRSTDNGDNWVRIDTQKVKPYGIYVAVNGDGTLFFGGAKSGVNSECYRSTDNGVSWTNITNNITTIDNQASFRYLFAASNGMLFAGTSAGLYRSAVKTTDVALTGSAIPNSFALDQNFPNPFNPETALRYHLAATGMVTLTVHDLLGREVATLVNQVQNAGSYSVRFDATGLASGVYLYSLRAGNTVLSRKMLLLK